LFAAVGWLQRGQICIIGGGRKNSRLMYQCVSNIRDYQSTLMFVSFLITVSRCGDCVASAGKGMDRDEIFIAPCPCSLKSTGSWDSLCPHFGRKVCMVGFPALSKWLVTQGRGHFKGPKRSNKDATSKLLSSRPLRTQRRQCCSVFMT
jgi:hypothetical protein